MIKINKSLQREGDGFRIEFFQDVNEDVQTIPPIFFVRAQDACEAFFAVKRNPCKLAAMVV